MPYHIAGIDVHKKMLAVVVADVKVEGEYQFVRRKVGTSPAELRTLAEWLVEGEVAEVVMESTAQYWRPVREALEQYWRPVRRHYEDASPMSGQEHEFRRLAPHLIEAPLTFKQSLSKADHPIRQVCFPDSGVCSVMSVMHSGKTAEVGTVGNEGVTGLALFFGDVSEPSESMIQVPGKGRLLSAKVLQRELARHAVLHRLIAHYAHAFTVQSCNRRHVMPCIRSSNAPANGC